MKVFTLATALLVLTAIHAPAATLYVNLNCTNPVPPYTSWGTAATNIQNAIDASSAGDLILVTNGIYATGGRVVYGTLTNRVVINKAITLQSVNGPTVTIIEGYRDPTATQGSTNSIRCLYLTNGAVVLGFTLTNGGTVPPGPPYIVSGTEGGGVWCESTNVILSNCVLIANSAVNEGGGVYSGTLNSCIIASNSVTWASGSFGGGAYLSTLNNCLVFNNSATHFSTGGYGGGIAYGNLKHCTLAGNTALSGGAAAYSTLVSCTLTNNSANTEGGGTLDSILTNCVIASNQARGGGGAYGDGGPAPSILDNCTLSDNVVTNGIGGGGGGAYGSTLNNCTLSGNVAWTVDGGGGAAESTLNDCLVISNLAPVLIKNGSFFAVGYGGGTYDGSLNNCVVAYNTAGTNGGGSFRSTLVNCTVVGNSAPLGGGESDSTLENCIAYYNTAPIGPNYSGGTLDYSCTTPLTNGLDNITSAPLFVNLAGGDFHLQSQSPCINSGNNTYITSATDLDGNPRIVGGTVDIGAYEYQTPVSKISYAWLQQYGLPITTNIDTSDLDGTGFNVYQDWIAGLNPTNSLSVLAMLPPIPANNPAGLVVSWESVSNRTYFLQSSTNLASHPAFSTIQSNILGSPTGTNRYTDTSATNAGPYFYRVGVQ